jgi:hypothetical protein
LEALLVAEVVGRLGEGGEDAVAEKDQRAAFFRAVV